MLLLLLLLMLLLLMTMMTMMVQFLLFDFFLTDCDQMGNKGAIIRFSKDMKPSYVKFTHVEHPPIAVMAYAGNMRSMMGM